MERLIPDPGPTTIAEQLGGYRPWEDPPADRPRLALNFAGTLDGRASIDGRSGSIGSDTDTAMLVGLRERFDAIMIGSGTMNAEHYGRIVADPARRAAREELGLPGDPPVAIVGSLDLPWDDGLFTEGGGEVLVFTTDEGDAPETATPVKVIREEAGRVDLASAMRRLRTEHDVRALLCEGGPRIHSELWGAKIADELFLTIAPKLVGAGTTILEGALPEVVDLELAWLLHEGPELFGRYRRSR